MMKPGNHEVDSSGSDGAVGGDGRHADGGDDGDHVGQADQRDALEQTWKEERNKIPPGGANFA